MSDQASPNPPDPSLNGAQLTQLNVLSYAIAHRNEPITISRLAASLGNSEDPAEQATLHDAVDRLVEGELLNRQEHRNKNDAHLAPTKALRSLVDLFWGRTFP